jgi:hypothetical protein
LKISRKRIMLGSGLGFVASTFLGIITESVSAGRTSGGISLLVETCAVVGIFCLIIYFLVGTGRI